MSQMVQELIDKIKTDGVEAADQKAKEIEDGAQAKAKKIVADAEAQAAQIIADAKTQAQKIHESTQAALKQSARDTLLALKKEIEKILQKVVSAQVNEALSPEYLAKIIGEVIKKSVETNLAGNEIEVVLSGDDLKKLKEGFMAKLQGDVKQSVKLKSGDEMTKGFVISFDEGKSSFDFSSASLAEYLSAYLNEQVAELLSETK